MSGWFQVRHVEGTGARVRAPIVARARSLGGAYAKLAELRQDGLEDARLGVFQPTRRDGHDGRWWRMPRLLG